MIHELLIALMGHTGDIIESETFRVVGGYPNLHPAEIAIMNEIALVGKHYKVIEEYIEDYETSDKKCSFERNLQHSLEKWLDGYKATILDLECQAMEPNRMITLGHIYNCLSKVFSSPFYYF